MRQDASQSSPLSPHRAFVVQLHDDTDVAAGRVTGRVEHVVSRQATSFQSIDDLFAFIARVLHEVRDSSSRQDP